MVRNQLLLTVTVNLSLPSFFLCFLGVLCSHCIVEVGWVALGMAVALLLIGVDFEQFTLVLVVS